MKNSANPNPFHCSSVTFDLATESFPSQGGREFEAVVEVPLSSRPETISRATRELESVLDGVRSEVAHWCRLSAGDATARVLRVHVRFIRDEDLLALKALDAGTS